MQQTLNRFDRVVALVLGDVMLDRFWWGSVSRISPEAPVPVVRLDRSSLIAGGAANVAANIASLGATPLLVGLLGDDDGGRQLPLVLSEAGVAADHLLSVADRPTTVKTRIVAHQQQVVRVDHEATAAINSEQMVVVISKFNELLPEADVVVLSDYAKGILTPELLKNVIGAARELSKPVVIDPKGTDYLRYAGATLLTPNRLESYQACGLEVDGGVSISEVGALLLDRLAVGSILITQGEDGMTLFQRGQDPLHLPASARAVYDVTGAGDTVIATLSLALGAGADLSLGAELANIAAGLAVEQLGTTAIGLGQLSQAVSEFN